METLGKMRLERKKGFLLISPPPPFLLFLSSLKGYPIRSTMKGVT